MREDGDEQESDERRPLCRDEADGEEEVAAFEHDRAAPLDTTDGSFAVSNHFSSSFAELATRSGVRIITGDFNGNGHTDIALVRQDEGWTTLPIAFSDGDGTFTVTNKPVGDFARWATQRGVEVITGDFNGNGNTDVALVREQEGWSTVPMALARPTVRGQGVGDNFKLWIGLSR